MRYSPWFLALSLLLFPVPFIETASAAEGGEPTQTISHAGSRASVKGPAEYFTGTVRIDPLFPAKEAAPFSGAYVTFEPEARSYWHIHPTGQHLLVTAGVGRTGEWGGPVEEIKAGDVIWCPPKVKHWHGASPSNAMTHIAITGTVDGKNVEWMEPVTDAQYNGNTVSEVRKVNPNGLSPKQQGIVAISAFTANGDLEKLKTALHEGLEKGLTVNEIKEVLVHLYAYAGFPRSLNGIHTFMAVMDERQKKGIQDETGREASPLPADMDKDAYGAKVRADLFTKGVIPPPGGYQIFAPAIDTFLKQHLFADIFARDILDHRSRELATISALASMTGTSGQLRAHLGGAMNSGLTEAQLRDFLSVLKDQVGAREAESAEQLLNSLLQGRK